jgi:hypothetical protein
MKIIPNIKYKSVLSEYTDIKERNKAFNSLDPQSQRLEIAWDALQLVKQDKISASSGYYWGANLSEKIEFFSPKKTQTFLLNKIDNSCEACQRGLMMISQIRLGNELCIKSNNYVDCGNEGIIKGFDLESFLLMEKEYEYSLYKHPYRNNTEEKLANICCNILVNGDFNIEDKTNYLTIK